MTVPKIGQTTPMAHELIGRRDAFHTPAVLVYCNKPAKSL